MTGKKEFDRDKKILTGKKNFDRDKKILTGIKKLTGKKRLTGTKNLPGKKLICDKINREKSIDFMLSFSLPIQFSPY